MELDYTPLDRPDVLNLLFHPRREPPTAGAGVRDSARHVMIPVEDAVELGARLHLFDPSFVNVLFFHGNGEIAADYDDMAPVYGRIGVNFCPVDYRGYGRSTGTPTCSALIRDAHAVLDFVARYLTDEGYGGPVVIMGRSLGSAPAIELAAEGRHPVRGLIVESGFAHIVPLLRLLGINVERLGVAGMDLVGNHEKIRRIRQPTLIIHAEFDRIIPFSDARDLYEASAASDKRLVRIPDAGHNDIFYRGVTQYLAAIKGFLERLRETG